ncbi:MAG: hypothetical protein CUN55_16535, partial [Phototrophicales bacterium]
MIYGAIGAGVADLAMDTAELAYSEGYEFTTGTSDDVSFLDHFKSLAGDKAVATLELASGYSAISALVELASPDDNTTSGQEVVADVNNNHKVGNATRGADIEHESHSSDIEKQQSTRFTDEILTEAGDKSHDSLWKSARNIIENNPKDFGFKGDVSDSKAVYDFAERMTADLVSEMDDVKDLVHNQDLAVIEKGDDGQWHLSLEDTTYAGNKGITRRDGKPLMHKQIAAAQKQNQK